MSGRRIVLAVLALCVLGGAASSRAALPWDTAGDPRTAEPEEVREGQLPLARARIEGATQIWVGQTVSVNVEVIVPTWFTGAPAFPRVEVKNAVTLSPEDAVNFVEQCGGKSFSGQSRTYLVCPQAKGKYTVPSLKVGVTYALPDGTPSPQAFPASAPVQFEARMPPGAEKARYFLTTEGFQISQSVSGAPDELEVGDSLTRTVRMSAQNAVGISLPPLTFEAPEGVRLYPGVPKVTETTERGTLEASRTDSATYVPEKKGRYRLPGITVLWWNPRTQTMNEASLPAVDLRVRPASGVGPEQFASSQEDEAGPAAGIVSGHRGSRAALLGGLALLAAGLILLAVRRVLGRRGPSLREALAGKRRRRVETETAYFSRFRKAIRSNDPRAGLRCLVRWLDRAATGSSVPTLRRFAAESGIPELEEETRELKGLLFSPKAGAERARTPESWSGTRLYRLVARARRVQRKRDGRQDRAPPLLQDINGAGPVLDPG